MPPVLVHGVPETPAVWNLLLGALEAPDAVRLQLPGFGCDLPDGFEPTMYAYADWLAAELGAIDGPVDLVAHDWGALLSVKVLGDDPALARSWVTDLGHLNDDHQWHDMAKLWQTEGEGEAFMEGFVGGDDASRAELLVATGAPAAGARALAGPIDARMASAILVLYRSAVTIGKEWGSRVDAITTPALVLDPTEDPFTTPGTAAALAARVGGQVQELDGAGHWWMLDAPDAAAAAITEFWAGLA